MRDPRYKHEYLDRVQIWVTIRRNDDDESDKHLEARDCRYSCLIFLFLTTKYSLILDEKLSKKSMQFLFTTRQKIRVENCNEDLFTRMGKSSRRRSLSFRTKVLMHNDLLILEHSVEIPKNYVKWNYILQNPWNWRT